MYTSDKRILRLIDHLIYQKQISSSKDFCNEIGFLEQTVSKIKTGKNHFTVLQIERICKKFNVNSNWIFGIEKKVFNTPSSIEIVDV